ncbi:unnamed protein product, partial [Laminaria digitata]
AEVRGRAPYAGRGMRNPDRGSQSHSQSQSRSHSHSLSHSNNSRSQSHSQSRSSSRPRQTAVTPETGTTPSRSPASKLPPDETGQMRARKTLAGGARLPIPISTAR